MGRLLDRHGSDDAILAAVTDEIDTARVICSLQQLRETGTRGFSVGEGDWPLRGVVVLARDGATGAEVRAFVNRCPHAGHPLNLRPHEFLTADGALLVCHSHGALFEKDRGLCIAGPCAGRSLKAIDVVLRDGFVMLADADADAEPG